MENIRTTFFINGNIEGTRERDNQRDAANSKRGDRNNASKRGVVSFRRMSSRQIDSVSLLDSGISCGVYFDRKWLFCRCFFSPSPSLPLFLFLSLRLFSIGLAGRWRGAPRLKGRKTLRRGQKQRLMTRVERKRRG